MKEERVQWLSDELIESLQEMEDSLRKKPRYINTPSDHGTCTVNDKWYHKTVYHGNVNIITKE